MTTSPLTSHNTAFFSVTNNSYIPYAATSLLSIRRFLPDAKLFILGRSISSHHQRLLNHHQITFIPIDLTYLFFQTWDYPTECFYLFAGPQIFHQLGFQYSVYLDGDILCMNNPLNNCPEIRDFGGVNVNTYDELFGAEKPLLSNLFNISPRHFQGARLHSGVIYMNNAKLVKLRLLEKSGELFYQCWENGIPRKGDDSLFALLQLSLKDSLSLTKLSNNYNYIPHYVGFKLNPSIVFFHFTFDKPWKPRPYRHHDLNQNTYHPYLKEYRRLLRKTSFSAWLNTLLPAVIICKICRKLSQLFRQIPFVLKGIRQPILLKRRHLKLPPIKLYWWNPPHINNFGDQVSKDIIFNLLGRSTIWSPLENCDLLAAGSILGLAGNTTRNTIGYVWGSGFISPDDILPSHLVYHAVRGKKTTKKLKQTVTTGDPGILANATFALHRHHFSQKIGVVIHYADMKTTYAKRFCEDSRFTVISPLDTPENVAKQISQCGLILSSSLHGLIFADSLSIPCYHISLSQNITGGDYKFKDYYSGVGKKYTAANLNLTFQDAYLKELKQNYHPIPHLARKQRALIKSFPFHKF